MSETKTAVEPLILAGDCLEYLRDIDDDSIDAIITDPPYGLSNTDPSHVVEAITQWVGGNREFVPHKRGGFMGKSWDSFVPPPAVWDECLRILKPGGHLLTFAGTRTMDLMTLGLRLSGFDIRDSIAWLYGSGFPKSMDVSKAIDKAAGTEREVVGTYTMPADSTAPGFAASGGGGYEGAWGASRAITAPATDEARQWAGWGTALKPAFEPVVVARKPFKGTVAANVLEHGTGALNIDGCRVEGGARPLIEADYKPTENSAYEGRMDGSLQGGSRKAGSTTAGRWPTNVVLDDSQAAALDEQSGELKSGIYKPEHADNGKAAGTYGAMGGRERTVTYGGDSGGASRFFPTFRYQAKAPKRERPVIEREDGTRTVHPTVKPLELMRWLVRLVTPPGGIVLDPFAGSGTTIEAGMLEGFEVWAIESEADYLPLIQQRVDRVMAEAHE